MLTRSPSNPIHQDHDGSCAPSRAAFSPTAARRLWTPPCGRERPRPAPAASAPAVQAWHAPPERRSPGDVRQCVRAQDQAAVGLYHPRRMPAVRVAWRDTKPPSEGDSGGEAKESSSKRLLCWCESPAAEGEWEQGGVKVRLVDHYCHCHCCAENQVGTHVTR